MTELVVKSATAADGTFSATGTTVWNAGMGPDSGQLSVPFGGTGAATLTGLLEGNGASAITAFAMGTGVKTALGINTGSAGAVVLFNGALGTPSSGTATNLTGTAAGLTAGTANAVAVGGITGLGTGVATALAINVGTAGAPVVNGGAGGTPSSLTLTNATGLVTAGINNDQVTYAKIQNVSATDRLLGRVTSGAGDIEEIPLGTGLAFSGGALVNTVTPTGGTVDIEDEGVAEGAADTIDFVGAGVSVGFAAGKATVTIAGGGASEIIFADAPNQDFDVTNGGSGGAVTILSESVTGLVAGDQIQVEIWMTLFNNSGGARTYSHTGSLGSLAVAGTATTTLAASATNRSIIRTTINFSVSATNLTFGSVYLTPKGPANADAAANAASTLPNVWDSTTSDLTGTQTVSYSVSSNSTTGTQTMTLHSYVIRKVSTTP